MATIKIDFLFDREYKKICESTSLPLKYDKTRAISIPSKQEIFIRLNSMTWKTNLAFSEEMFFDSITKTIVHENIHLLIDDREKCWSYNTEEKICRIMAEQ